MGTIQITIQQTLVMFLLIGVGYLLYRTGKVDLAGGKNLASLLVTIVIPAVIFNSFAVEYTAQKAKMLLICTFLSVVLLLLSGVAGHFLFSKNAINNFAVTFPNPGFFGLPLINAALGGEAVIYAAPFIVCLNIAQYSYGGRLMRGEKSKIDWCGIIKNPIFISAVIGVLIFVCRVQVPGIIASSASMLANLNGPLAMLVMGVYLAQTDLHTLFTRLDLYAVTVARLLLVPALTLLLLWCIPLELPIRQVMLIAAACPVGANVAVYAQLTNRDYGHAVQTVIHSTAFCILSIPFILYLAQVVW